MNSDELSPPMGHGSKRGALKCAKKRSEMSRMSLLSVWNVKTKRVEVKQEATANCSFPRPVVIDSFLST